MEPKIKLLRYDGIKTSYVDHMSQHIVMPTFHYHSGHELLVVEAGVTTIHTEQAVHKVSGSFLIFYPAGMLHQQINDMSQPYRRYCCHFPAALPNSGIPTVFPNRLCVAELKPPELERIRPYLELMMDTEPQATYQFRCQHLLAILLSELAPIVRRSIPHTDSNVTAAEQLVRDICLYLDAHSTETLRLEEIAKHFFISRAKLVRIFRAVLGMTVCDYIRALRIEKSKQHLLDGASVQETAALNGFSNVGYYIRTFRKYTGTTPAKFRAGK